MIGKRGRDREIGERGRERGEEDQGLYRVMDIILQAS